MIINGLEPEAQKWVTNFSNLIADPKSRQDFINNPVDNLKSIGLALEADQQDAVISSLQAVALSHKFENTDDNIKAKKSKAVSSDFKKHFHWKVEFYGFELKIDHEAIKQLPNPVDAIGLLAEATFSAVIAAGAVGPNAVVIALGVAYWGAIFTAYVIMLPLIDEGKGVNLTITWPQISIAVASGGLLALAALPIPTTAKK